MQCWQRALNQGRAEQLLLACICRWRFSGAKRRQVPGASVLDALQGLAQGNGLEGCTVLW